MTYLTQYQARVNGERLKRQAPAVQKIAKEMLEQLKTIELYLYWALDPEDGSNGNSGNLIQHAHALVDIGHEYRAALKANPPADENEITST